MHLPSSFLGVARRATRAGAALAVAPSAHGTGSASDYLAQLVEPVDRRGTLSARLYAQGVAHA